MANEKRLIDAYKPEDLIRSNNARYHHADDVKRGKNEWGRPRLEKAYFYEQLKPFSNKYLPIHFDCPVSKDNLRFRIIFSWHSRKPNGEFNPIMSCQLVDTFKQGYKKYVVPDLIFDCQKEGVTTDFKLYKYLAKWIDNAFAGYVA